VCVCGKNKIYTKIYSLNQFFSHQSQLSVVIKIGTQSIKYEAQKSSTKKQQQRSIDLFSPPQLFSLHFCVFAALWPAVARVSCVTNKKRRRQRDIIIINY
jgi:hypothetical protein